MLCVIDLGDLWPTYPRVKYRLVKCLGVNYLALTASAAVEHSPPHTHARARVRAPAPARTHGHAHAY